MKHGRSFFNMSYIVEVFKRVRENCGSDLGYMARLKRKRLTNPTLKDSA